jgi:hypothetical protein
VRTKAQEDLEYVRANSPGVVTENLETMQIGTRKKGSDFSGASLLEYNKININKKF